MRRFWLLDRNCEYASLGLGWSAETMVWFRLVWFGGQENGLKMRQVQGVCDGDRSRPKNRSLESRAEGWSA